MRTVTNLLVVGAVLCLVAAVVGDDAKKESEKLQGTWKATAVEKGGNQDEPGDHRIVFAGDSFTIKRGDQVIIKGKFKLDPTKSPKEIDVEITEDEGKENNGKTAVGVYSVERDTLKWCTAEPGETTRPKELKTAAGAKEMMVTLTREK